MSPSGYQRLRVRGRSAARRRWPAGLTPAVLLSIVNLLSGACGVDLGYLIPAAVGQIELLRHSVPVSQAIEAGGLTEEQVAKLELIEDARRYARDVIGLNVEENYTRFYDSGDEPVAFNVSACRKDAFEAQWWSFPIVGTVPYLGFFDRAAADAKFNELATAGLDVLMYEIDAYSGLGYFPNPILSPMLERSEVNLADTVFHELLHSTIWRPNDTTFNESLATFVGRTGAVRYFAERHSDRPELVREAIETFEDTDRYSDFALSLFNELDVFYSSDLSSAAKIAGREAIYEAGRERFAAEVQPLMNRPERYDWIAQLPANNAWMLSIRRYNLDLDVFEQVFAVAGEDWAAVLRLFQAAAGDSNPYAYLRAWLESPDSAVSANSSKATPAADPVLRDPSLPTPPGNPRGPCSGHLSTTILRPDQQP